MNNNYKEDVLDGLITAALRQNAIEEVDNAPSDEELKKMFPLEHRHRRLLRKYTKREKRPRTQPLPVIYLKRVAIIVLSVITISFGLLMTNTEVRAAVKKAVVEFFDKYVKINLSNSDIEEDDFSNIDLITIGYIPNGFELVDSDESKNTREYMYFDDEGNYLNVSIDKSEFTENNADIEKTDYEKINIGNHKGYILYKEEEQDGVIIFGNKHITVTLTGIVSKEELVKIAESIKQIAT